MDQQNFQKRLPLFIGIGLALIIVGFYIASGRSSMDQNMRELEKASTVEKVIPAENNTLLVQCKNGETYEIIYQKDQTNFQDLVYDKCGEAGVESTSTMQVQ